MAVCRIRAYAYMSKSGVIQSSNTTFHHRAYIRIYYSVISCNNHVIFTSLLYPHVVVRILKNDYEHTRKKGRHFTIHLCHYYDYSIYIQYIIIQGPKYPFTPTLYRSKKRDLKKFFMSGLIACITCVFVLTFFSPMCGFLYICINVRGLVKKATKLLVFCCFFIFIVEQYLFNI